MPIYKGTTYIERSYKGNSSSPTRRIYKEKQLVYGLYDIIYYNYDGKYIPGDHGFNEISCYSWGKNRYIVPASKNTLFNDKTAATEGYKTHWDGWWDDNEYKKERSKWSTNSRYIVSYLDNVDLTLFAKWRQKKFTFSGTVGWDESEIPVDGELISKYYTPITRNPPASANPSTGYSELCGCTSWVECRRYSLSGFDEVPSYSRYTSGEKHDVAQPGDVAIYGTEDNFHHMGFVENTNIESYTSPYTSEYDSEHVHHCTPGTCWSDLYGFFSSGARAPGTVHETLDVKETNCENQDTPSIPDASKYHEGSSWDVQNKYTYERTFEYTTSGSGTWGSWGDKVNYWKTDW